MAVASQAAVAVRVQRWPQRFTVVTLLCLSVVVLYMDRVNMSVVAPVLMHEFGWDPAVMGTVLSAFFVGYFLTQIPGGWLSTMRESELTTGSACRKCRLSLAQ
jgi:MFS family permease